MTDKILLTKEKIKELREELVLLKGDKRDQLADKLEWYRDNQEDDVDSEYYTILEEKEVLEGRISEIEDILIRAKQISSSTKYNKVEIGCEVKLSVKGKIRKLMIVSEAEADSTKSKISNKSPLGKKLMDKEVGETVEVDTPSGMVEYEIKSIS